MNDLPIPSSWTEEEVRRLRDLYASETPFDEVAEAFPGRTVNAIRMKASRLGVRRLIPQPPSRSTGILLCSDGNGRSVGFLMRCHGCSGWIQVSEGEESRGAIVCGECGSVSYFVS